MINVSVVIGNPKAQSRTTQVATRLADRLLPVGEFDIAVIELADYGGRLFDFADKELQALNSNVANSDLLIVATPTYKAAYTGLLKSFLDRYSNLGLSGVVAIPVMTGADQRHSLAPDFTLRPLLVELGASVPTQSLYFIADQVDQLDAVLDPWVAEAAQRLRTHLPQILPPTID